MSQLKPMKKSNYAILGIAVMLTALRFYLACSTPVTVVSSQAYDDDLLFTQAENLLSGNWMGTYGNMTIAKNPGYSMVLAFCGVTHIPYQVVFVALHIASAICFVMAIRPLENNPIVLVATYSIILYMPCMFSYEYFGRIYRMGIGVPFVICLFSSYLAILFRFDKSIRKLLPWIAIAAVSLVFIYIHKEDGIWVIPFVIAATIVIVLFWIWSLRNNKLAPKDLTRKTIMLTVPILALVISTAAISTMNQSIYGVYAMNDRYETSFSNVTADLSAIDAHGSKEDYREWVSWEAIEKAMMVSPTLESIHNELEESFAAWGGDEKHVDGDLPYWTIRDALARAGSYSDAKIVEAFWGSVHHELEAAFNDGRLSAENGLRISKSTEAITLDDLSVWVHETANNLITLITGSEMRAYAPGSLLKEGRDMDAIKSIVGPSVVEPGVEDALSPAVSAIENALIGIGIVGLYVLIVVGTVAFIGIILPSAIRKELDIQCVMTLIGIAGCTLSCILLLVSVSWSMGWITESARRWAAYQYCAGCYPLMYMSLILVICCAMRIIANPRKLATTR